MDLNDPQLVQRIWKPEVHLKLEFSATWLNLNVNKSSIVIIFVPHCAGFLCECKARRVPICDCAQRSYKGVARWENSLHAEVCIFL